MSVLALMCLPLLMGADCNDDVSGSDVVSIVSIVTDAILAIVFAFS